MVLTTQSVSGGPWTSMSAHLGAWQKNKTSGLYLTSILLGSAHNQVPKELV